MELRQIRYFNCIAELGSLTKAAKALCIAQPALSVQMRNLEDELGVQLLLRHSRGVLPTEAGQVFWESVKRIIAEVDGLSNLAETSSSALSDPVCLAVNPSVDPEIVGQILTAADAALPEIPLSFCEGSSDQICEWLLDGTAHIGLVYFAPEDIRGVELEFLAHEDLVLLSRHDELLPQTVTIADAVAAPLILQPHPHKLRNLVELAAARISTEPRVILEISSVTIILDLVERGYGATILPESAVKRVAVGGPIQAQRITGQNLGLDLSLAYVRDVRRTQSEIMVSRLVRDIINQIHAAPNGQYIHSLTPIGT